LRYSIAGIAAISPKKSMEGSEHYINHLVFSPSGKYFAFMHLWTSPTKRYSRMFVAPLAGGAPKLVDDVEHFSHFCWSNDNVIVAFYHGRQGKGYYRFNLHEGNAVLLKDPLLVEDGHPSFFPGGNHFVSDTYPDGLRRQHLLLGQLDPLTVKDLGGIY